METYSIDLLDLILKFQFVSPYSVIREFGLNVLMRFDDVLDFRLLNLMNLVLLGFLAFDLLARNR
jgi:hypothetical protein